MERHTPSQLTARMGCGGPTSTCCVPSGATAPWSVIWSSVTKEQCDYAK
ncbi:hypothetical protein IMZ48_08190 [Candidatus Bathyarchaeota archaeon]|nr:hypothetical protein [Candidatus Bathyarchaeota archaeon]